MPENHNTEYKLNWRDEWLKWICGFANSDGGTLYIGVDDNSNKIGVDNSQRLLEELPNKILSLLGLVASINLETDSGNDVVCIRVEPYPFPISYRGSYYFRSGSTNQELKGVALDRFLLSRIGKRWDGVPVPRIKVSELRREALELFRKKALASNRVDEEVLHDSDSVLLDNLELLDGKHLKRAAILLFYERPEKYFPGAYIKIGFFKTDDELVYQDEVHGCILEQIEKSWDLMTTKYTEGIISYDEVTRTEKSIIPKSALREALLNAIAHKDYSQPSPIQISAYSDHIVIWNEGHLPDDWTTESLKHKHPSKPFNPDIANTLFRSGYIESWGRGTIKMINECVKGEILPPDFNYNYSGFMVSFFSDTKKLLLQKGYAPPLIDIVIYALRDKEVNNTIVKDICKVSKATATRYLKQLEGEYLEKVGDTGRGTYYVLKGLNKGS